MASISLAEWDKFLSDIPDPHILQTAAWGSLKAEFGWKLAHIVTPSCGAQILLKSILPGINFAYIPKGPLGSSWENIWPEIDTVCRDKKCIFVKIEPDLWENDPRIQDNSPFHLPDRFIQSEHTIQPRRSLVIDLTGDEAHMLGRMKQKTRYNINLALKKNVIVQSHIELSAFYDLMKITGQRDQFGIHSLEYYQKAFELFHSRGECELLVAEYNRTPISALIVFKVGRRAWYFYGASSDLHREMMPNYLLQWEAIRWAKNQGCVEYDLWGVPDEDLEVLEANFTSRNDGLWGVYRFKRGFGGELKRSVGTWDKIYNPFLYRFYTYWVKYKAQEG
jgi:peptidoglycan pentaglycine glycine transferase (the first glycine)